MTPAPTASTGKLTPTPPEHPAGSAGPRVLRLGTRRSTLARTQSQWVADKLAAFGHEVELVDIVTEGDTSRAPLASMGGTGVFAAALRQALRDGRVDLAVHSLKDLPVAPEPGLAVVAVPQREDARDALIARDGLTLAELPTGSSVGTGSPRRAAQLEALGLGLRVQPIRGNVDTRIDFVRRGELDAVVLARAGLDRVGRTDEITETIQPVQMLPAPGQGALAVEVREDDAQMCAIAAAIEHSDTRIAVTAERALLGALGAGCSAPIGALAELSEDVDGSLEISLRAFIGTVDGSFGLRRWVNGKAADAARLGAELAATLLADGAADHVDLQPSLPTPDGRQRPPVGDGNADTPQEPTP